MRAIAPSNCNRCSRVRCGLTAWMSLMTARPRRSSGRLPAGRSLGLLPHMDAARIDAGQWNPIHPPEDRLNSVTPADRILLDTVTEVQPDIDYHFTVGCICSKSAAKRPASVVVPRSAADPAVTPAEHALPAADRSRGGRLKI